MKDWIEGLPAQFREERLNLRNTGQTVWVLGVECHVGQLVANAQTPNTLLLPSPAFILALLLAIIAAFAGVLVH